ncbi:hypothetical protein RhiirC2_844664 [Rhizophagus irregularis]|uniref:MIR domain-containing protein n=1 Tax=Rhizophagus irregularis TaxID=588596 RepID=A0A2N1NSZ9_9GLOM|nr:hypothetical protein RhiirC2_844664 [Rhizophagus irregularis]
MNSFPKYDGSIHPDEWINDIKKYYNMWEDNYGGFLHTAKSLINPTIKLPTEINDLEKLRGALKKDISFTVFKASNKRKLQSLNYSGDILKFFTDFRNLCYNSETDDIEEQKEYFYASLNDNRYFLTEFYKRMKNINSMDELIKAFEEIELNIIRQGSIVALKHVATGKYLTSIKDFCYTTGSKKQLVFTGNSKFDPNALWKIRSRSNDEYGYIKTDLRLQHLSSNHYLGIRYRQYQIEIQNQYQSPFQNQYQNTFQNQSPFQYQYQYRSVANSPIQKQYKNQYEYHKSPSSNHTEVSCGEDDYTWNFKHSKLENYEGYLKPNDIVNLSIKKSFDINGPIQDGQVEFLRSHDVQFTIGNDIFQEVICHNERLGGIDEWCIELIKRA